MKKVALLWSAGLTTAAALAVAVVLVGFSCGSETQPEPPHAWVAFAFPHATDANAVPIRVFDAFDPATKRDLGSPGVYAVPKWSPDGRKLGAVQLIAEDSARFLLFDRQSGRERVVAVPDMLFSYWWSPDSTRVGVATRGHVLVFDREGRELGRIEIPPNPDGTFSSAGLVTTNGRPTPATSSHSTMA